MSLRTPITEERSSSSGKTSVTLPKERESSYIWVEDDKDVLAYEAFDLNYTLSEKVAGNNRGYEVELEATDLSREFVETISEDCISVNMHDLEGRDNINGEETVYNIHFTALGLKSAQEILDGAPGTPVAVALRGGFRELEPENYERKFESDFETAYVLTTDRDKISYSRLHPDVEQDASNNIWMSIVDQLRAIPLDENKITAEEALDGSRKIFLGEYPGHYWEEK